MNAYFLSTAKRMSYKPDIVLDVVLLLDRIYNSCYNTKNNYISICIMLLGTAEDLSH